MNEIREKIESLVGEYCDGTWHGLDDARFIEWFGEDSKRGPQELADRLVKLFEELRDDNPARN